MFNLNLSQTLTEIPDPIDNVRRPFLSPIEGEPGNFLLVLDNTSLDHIKRCHRNAWQYLVLGREAHARNSALTFGGAIHEGLELFHTWQWTRNHPSHDTAMIEYSYGKEAQDRAILNYFSLNPIPPDILAYDHRTPVAALEVMKHYRAQSNVELHPDYELEILADDEGPIIERSFEIPMAVLDLSLSLWDLAKILNQETWITSATTPKTPVRIHLAWSGRIDLICSINGRPRVLDHKTSSIDTPDYFRGFELSSQVRGYVWAAQQLWPDIKPKSFVHNGIFFKKPNKTNSSASLIARGAKGGEPPLAFKRTYYPSNVNSEYSDTDLSRWKRDTILLIEDFLHSVSRGVYPMNDANCVVKYGMCPYHDVCTLACDNEPAAMKYLMSPAFKPVTWNPTNPR